jgi:hypothetical protein
VFGQRYASNGTPLGPEFRVNTSTGYGVLQLDPSVAADSAGNFVVVWTKLQAGVFGQRYASNGTPLGPEFRVNTYTSGAGVRPSVAADPAGNFVVAWLSYRDGNGIGISAQRFAGSGAPLGPEFVVNTFTTANQINPAVVSDSIGNFVVTWQGMGQDGSGYGVFGQRYANGGTPLGPEFRVNTYTTSLQGYPSVAVDSMGNFLVIWHSDGQDGSNTGVFGQRYGQIVPVELMHFRVE